MSMQASRIKALKFPIFVLMPVNTPSVVGIPSSTSRFSRQGLPLPPALLSLFIRQLHDR